jgi:hypothetical protein
MKYSWGRLEHACQTFIESISEVTKTELSSKLRGAKFFSDDSTDSAVLVQELLYVRYLEGGLPVNKFLSVEALKAGDAASI